MHNPSGFLFHTEGGECESQDKHINEIYGSNYLESENDKWECVWAFGELVIEDECRTALEEPDETEETKPGHTASVTKKSCQFFAEKRIDRTMCVFNDGSKRANI